jgi:hypothetical protein
VRPVETDGYFKDPHRRKPATKRSTGLFGPGGAFSGLLSNSDSTDNTDAVAEYQFRDESGVDVDGLLDTVHTLGEQLKKDPRRQTLIDYKEAVKKLLGHIAGHGVRIEEHVSGHNIMRRKRFTILKVVDERLERLGAGILQSQRDQLEILRRVDEIYGMLVDLLR